MLYYPHRTAPHFPFIKDEIMVHIVIVKRRLRVAGIVAASLGIVFLGYWLGGYKPKRPESTSVIGTKTASATSTQKTSTTQPKILEGIFTICNLNQATLGVRSDSGKYATIGFTFVAVRDSLNEMIVLISSTPLMLSFGYKYKITYRELPDHLARLEDFNFRTFLPGNSVIQNSVAAHGMYLSAEFQKETSEQSTP